MRRRKLSPPPFWIAGLLLVLGPLFLALAALVTPTQAASDRYQGDTPTNDFCLACHQEEGIALTLGSDSLPVTINPTLFGLSVHAEEGLACVDCHTDISEYPHPEVAANSAHEFSISLGEACRDCHEEQYDAEPDSVHQRAFTAGNENAPLCADCHDPHTQGRLIGTQSGQLTIAARLHVP